MQSKRAKLSLILQESKFLKLREGNGYQPAQGQRVLVNYAGYLRANGQLFDSNIKEVAQANNAYDQQREMGGGYAPYPWEYSQKVGLIPGFKEALLTMKVGEKLRVFYPFVFSLRRKRYSWGNSSRCTSCFRYRNCRCRSYRQSKID